MPSPFERAFTSAYDRSATQAMKSLDDERQEKRLQERMLEQRQYDASLLEGSKAYAANLLKDSNKIDQDRIDAATKLAAQRTEQANFPINYRLAIEAGVPASELKEMTWENNAAIIAMTGRETQGRKEGEQQASTGALPTLTDLFGETSYARGVLKKFDDMNVADIATKKANEADANRRKIIRDEGDLDALIKEEATFTADHPYENIPKGSTIAWLKKRSEDLKQNVTEGKDYKKVLDELEYVLGHTVEGGMPLGELSFLLENAKYDKTSKRHIGQTDAVSKINMLASSNTYLGERLQLLNAEERKLVLSSSNDPNEQAAFLRTRMERVVTSSGPTIANPSGVDVVTYRLILPPAPAAGAEAGAGAEVEEGSASDIFNEAMRKIKANSIKRDVTPAPGAGEKLPNPPNYPFRPAPGAGYYRLPPHFPVRPSGLNSTRDSGVTNRLVPLTLDPRLNAK